jgi:hypothetical protein
MAKRRKGQTFESIVSSKLLELNDAELLTLRGHALTERALYALLAARLDVSEDQLPDVSFWVLNEIALAGDRLKGMRAAVAEFATIRNDVAHRLETRGFDEQMGAFAMMLWQPDVGPKLKWPADHDNQIDVYREAIKSLILTIRLEGTFIRQR